MHVYETQDKAISNVKYQKEGKKNPRRMNE